MTSDGEKTRAALEALVRMVEQWCHICPDTAGELWLDSSSYSAHAAAMRVLANFGLLTIRTEFGNRVIAKWTEKAREFGADWDFSELRKLKRQRQPIQKGPARET